MIKVTLLGLFLAAYICLSTADLEEEYHWRDFDKEIPNDAFAVSDGVYIGQALTNEGQVLIGSLANSSTSLHVYDTTTDLPLQVKSNIKILCTKNPNKFIWVSNAHKNEIKVKLIRIYAGTITTNGYYRKGSLVVARIGNGTNYAVGYHDVELNDIMYYVDEDKAQKANTYEELFFVNSD